MMVSINRVNYWIYQYFQMMCEMLLTITGAILFQWNMIFLIEEMLDMPTEGASELFVTA